MGAEMSGKLKAWIVSGEEWSELLHAETSGKARSIVAGIFDGDFLYLRATRFPKADGRAFTAADRFEADGDAEHDDRYISECSCINCDPKRKEKE